MATGTEDGAGVGHLGLARWRPMVLEYGLGARQPVGRFGGEPGAQREHLAASHDPQPAPRRTTAAQ